MSALKKLVGVVVLGGFLIAGNPGLRAAEAANGKELKPQTTCPIMGGKVNKDLYVDHDGKRIFVCCKACVAAVKKDPEGAIKKLAAKGEAPVAVPLKAQTTCPIMGGKINKKLYVDHNGQRIYVCCAGCVAPVKKDFEGAVKKLAAKGEAPEDLTPRQKICPVMGGKINPELFVEHEGKKIYVCCEDCVKVVKKDPAKYAKKVAEAIAKQQEKKDAAAADPHGKMAPNGAKEHEERDNH